MLNKLDVVKFAHFTPLSRWMIGLGLISVVITGGGVLYFSHSTKSTLVATPTVAQSTKVTALGRLQPQGEVIHVSAPASSLSRNN